MTATRARPDRIARHALAGRRRSASVLPIFAALWLLSPALSGANRAEARSAVSFADREKINHAVAARGNAGTVGIYCRHEHPQERYFGTGAVISRDGYILTSSTVVPRGAREIEIYFTNRRRRQATIVEINEKIEAVLLKVEADDLTPLPVAQALPQVGERAYTFGNAFNMIRLGEHASFSAGWVSGLYPVKSADSQSTYEGLAIETDAAINPGQDGGPLLDAHGRLTGVISLSFSDLRWQGVAVPLVLIEAGLETLRSGKVRLSRQAIVKPPAEDLAEGNALLRAARELRKSMVSIEIKRRFPPESIPQVYLPHYLRNDPRLAKIEDMASRRLLNEISQAERLLAANAQLRRPGAPVTGIVVSPHGDVLTSHFNIMADPVLTDGKGRVPKHAFTGSLRDLLKPPKNMRQQRNRVEKYEVTLADGRRWPADLRAQDRTLGLALLRIRRSKDDSSVIPHVSLSDLLAEPRLGENIAVIGVVEGDIPYTLNCGIVSAAQRSRGRSFQYDAMINYGNSGGPVVNAQGRIVGLATAPMNPGPIMGRILSGVDLQRWPIAPNGGLSMGAPLPRIAESLPTLLKGENITRIAGTYVGISPKVTGALTERVIIGAVAKGSPAAKAGMRVGDRIVSVDGDPVLSWKDLMTIIDERETGDKMAISIRRGDKAQALEVEVVLEERP